LDPDASVIMNMKFSEPVVLVRPPFRVAFSFAGQDRQWQPTWQGKDLLPRAIQATIRNSATGQILIGSSPAKVPVTGSAGGAHPNPKTCDDALNQANTPNAPGTPQNNSAPPPATAGPTTRGGM